METHLVTSQTSLIHFTMSLFFVNEFYNITLSFMNFIISLSFDELLHSRFKYWYIPIDKHIMCTNIVTCRKLVSLGRKNCARFQTHYRILC